VTYKHYLKKRSFPRPDFSFDEELLARASAKNMVKTG
jgi:hypothetical protein